MFEFYSNGVHLSANVDARMQFAHKAGVGLTPKEQDQIIAFLQTLTDSAFITNPRFSNPFAK